jgi:predicted PurR-regulated permease PerM
MVLGGIVLTLAYFVNMASKQIIQIKDQLSILLQDPELDQKVKNWLIRWNTKIESWIPILKEYDLVGRISEAEFDIEGKIMPTIQGLFSSSQKILPSIFSAIAMITIIPFLTFFMLNSGRDMKKMLINLVPNSIFEPTLLLVDELDRQLGQYIRSRMIIETVALSIIASMSYWILGLKFFFFLGIFAGLANLIPYAGPVIGAVPALLMAFVGTNFGFTLTIILIVIISFAIQFVDNNIIFPVFVGKSVDLGPISTMISALIGAKLFGLIGLLMAVPIAAMLKVIVFEVIKQFKGYTQNA